MSSIMKECIYPSGMKCTMLLAFLLMIAPTWSQKYNFITVKLGTFKFVHTGMDLLQFSFIVQISSC